MTFEEFVASRLQALLRYAAVLTGDRDEARDLVQTVLANAFASWGRVAGADRPEAYVHRMLTNEFLNSRRGRRPRLVELTREVVSGRRAPTVADHAEQIGERGELWQRLQALPPRQRAETVALLGDWADVDCSSVETSLTWLHALETSAATVPAWRRGGPWDATRSIRIGSPSSGRARSGM
jgi:hypothetical protein